MYPTEAAGKIGISELKAANFFKKDSTHTYRLETWFISSFPKNAILHMKLFIKKLQSY